MHTHILDMFYFFHSISSYEKEAKIHGKSQENTEPETREQGVWVTFPTRGIWNLRWCECWERFLLLNTGHLTRKQVEVLEYLPQKQKQLLEAGEVTQWIQALAALAEDQSLTLSTSITRSRGFRTLCSLWGHQYSMAPPTQYKNKVNTIILGRKRQHLFLLLCPPGPCLGLGLMITTFTSHRAAEMDGAGESPGGEVGATCPSVLPVWEAKI